MSYEKCERCGGQMLQASYGKGKSCLQCGHQPVVVPDWVKELAETTDGRPKRIGRKPSHAGRHL